MASDELGVVFELLCTAEMVGASTYSVDIVCGTGTADMDIDGTVEIREALRRNV